MKICDTIEYIEVYYDGRCGMCCTFHEWVNAQERRYEVRFIAYQDERAEEWFPGVRELEPDKEMVVRTDNGDVFQAAEGWVLCLLSCVKYESLARKLATPLFLPLAQKTCHALAARRHKLSKIFFPKKEKAVTEVLHQMPVFNKVHK